MKKILIILNLCIVNGAFAAVVSNQAESSEVCQNLRQQMHTNHIEIDKAYDRKDACTMGKLMIQNRELFESHLECFPLRNRKMMRAPGASAAK